MKKIFILFVLVLIILGGGVFVVWSEKGLAKRLWETESPNNKFKIELYKTFSFTGEPTKMFAKLYDNETGKFIAESQVVLTAGSGRLRWGREDDYKAYLGVEPIFDLGEFDTKYSSFSK